MNTKSQNLEAAMRFVRDEIANDFPSQHLLLFLTVANNEGITMPQLEEELGIQQGVVSRSVKKLSLYMREPTAQELNDGLVEKKKAGHDLLRVEPDLYNRKVHAVYLTKRGKDILNRFIECVYGE